MTELESILGVILLVCLVGMVLFLLANPIYLVPATILASLILKHIGYK